MCIIDMIHTCLYKGTGNAFALPLALALVSVSQLAKYIVTDIVLFICHYWQWPILISCVILFVCSKMADETNLSSKPPVADRTREVWGRKLCWWCLSSGFLLCMFLLGFTDSFWFVFTSSPSYEASPLCSILCNLFPRLCWYVEILREALRVSLYCFFWPP